MNLKYKKAEKADADILINIYNLSFYEDYVKYGECPAYEKTKVSMEESIQKYQKLIIYSDDIPLGAISIDKKENGEYYLGCLCIIPEFQNKGIGKQAVKCILAYYKDWSKVTLITPADKEKNIAFYTKKCGFRIESTKMNGNVKVVHLLLER